MVMQLNTTLSAFVRLVRFPYWLLLGIICVLLMMVFQRGSYNFELMGLASITVALTSMGGFAINDYFDRESDAIVKPDRPIPSGQITPLGALQFSAIMFISALGVGLMINPLAFGIVIFNISFLLVYSSLVKKYSGFLSNIAIGLVEGITIPIFAEAALFQRVSVVSLSFMGFILVGIGINVLKDVAGVEGDKTIGVSSLAIKRGKCTAVRVGALFLVATAISLLVPYVEGVVTVAYLVPMALMGGIILHVALSLFKKTEAQDVKKLLKRFRTSLLVLFPVALIVGTFLLR